MSAKKSLFGPRWSKILADLWADRTRSLLVVASIAVGVFAIGSIVTTYAIYSEDVSVSYASAQPANIEVITDPFDDTLVRSVADMPGVITAEGRHMLSVRVSQDGLTWKALDIVATKDFAASEINLITPVDGTAAPNDRELAVREDLMNSTGYHPGDMVQVWLNGGVIRTLPVVGVVGQRLSRP